MPDCFCHRRLHRRNKCADPRPCDCRIYTFAQNFKEFLHLRRRLVHRQSHAAVGKILPIDAAKIHIHHIVGLKNIFGFGRNPHAARRIGKVVKHCALLTDFSHIPTDQRRKLVSRAHHSQTLYRRVFRNRRRAFQSLDFFRGLLTARMRRNKFEQSKNCALGSRS